MLYEVITDTVDLLFGQTHIHSVTRLDEHDRSLLASVETAGLDRLYGSDDPFLHERLCKVLEKLGRFRVVLAYAAWFWHTRRCTLLTLEDIKGWLRYSCHHIDSLFEVLV